MRFNKDSENNGNMFVFLIIKFNNVQKYSIILCNNKITFTSFLLISR